MHNRIRILATTDVHGCIYPYRYSDNQPADVGFARLNTLIRSLRDENTVLIDNGDVLEGSPLSFYHYHMHPEDVSPMSQVMRQMHYDYVNLGNHDFNYGQKALRNHLNNVGAACLTSNFIDHGKSAASPYMIRNLAGKKIAFIGVTTQYIPHWETPEHLQGILFTDALETLRKNTETVKEKEHPDYIIGVYHGGFERDLNTGVLTEEDTGENEGYRMIQEIPDLDVLITGHQHRTLCGELNHTVYTQTGDQGKELACIDIDTDTGKIHSRIIPADVQPDEVLLSSVQDEENECQTWLDSALGTSRINLKITDEKEARLHKSQVITFLNQVQKEYTGADICASSLFLGATGFEQQITMRNLVSTYVYPNTLVVKRITGKILKEYLEFDAKYWTVNQNGHIDVSPEYAEPKPQHYNYDMLDGIEYTIRVSNPVGKRIVSLTRNGKEIRPDDVFSICLNNYRAVGGGNFEMLKDLPVLSVNSSSMVELLADYILKHHVIDFQPVDNIQVIL